MRAVIPGFINYRYRTDGTLPGHTKSSFTKYDILTIHNVIDNRRQCLSFHALSSLAMLIEMTAGYAMRGRSHITFHLSQDPLP